MSPIEVTAVPSHIKKAVDEFKKYGSLVSALFYERDMTMEQIMVASLLGEHVLIIGDAGSTKSLMARTYMKNFTGLGTNGLFSTQFSAKTTEDSVFGPINIPILQVKGDYVRNIDGMLPVCKIAFLDEVLDASDTLLRSMLEVLNERTYSHPPQMLACPLHMAICTTNFLRDTPGMKAVLDRILFKSHVVYIKDHINRMDFYHLAAHGVLRARDENTKERTPEKDEKVHLENGAYRFDADSRFEFDTLVMLNDYLRKEIMVPDSVLELYDQLQTELHVILKLSQPFSDRRLGKLIGCIKASALLDGRRVANNSDLEQLKVGLIDFGVDEQLDAFTTVYEKLVENPERDKNIIGVVEKFKERLLDLRDDDDLGIKPKLKKVQELQEQYNETVSNKTGAPSEPTLQKMRALVDDFGSIISDLSAGMYTKKQNRQVPALLKKQGLM